MKNKMFVVLLAISFSAAAAPAPIQGSVTVQPQPYKIPQDLVPPGNFGGSLGHDALPVVPEQNLPPIPAAVTVPEPASISLIGLGLLGWAATRRRKAKRA